MRFGRGRGRGNPRTSSATAVALSLGTIPAQAQDAEWNLQKPPTDVATFGPAVNEGAIPETTEQTNFAGV